MIGQKAQKQKCWKFNEILQNKNKAAVVPPEIYDSIGLSTEISDLNITWINLGKGQIVGTKF